MFTRPALNMIFLPYCDTYRMLSGRCRHICPIFSQLISVTFKNGARSDIYPICGHGTWMRTVGSEFMCFLSIHMHEAVVSSQQQHRVKPFCLCVGQTETTKLWVFSGRIITYRRRTVPPEQNPSIRSLQAHLFSLFEYREWSHIYYLFLLLYLYLKYLCTVSEDRFGHITVTRESLAIMNVTYQYRLDMFFYKNTYSSFNSLVNILSPLRQSRPNKLVCFQPAVLAVLKPWLTLSL